MVLRVKSNKAVYSKPVVVIMKRAESSESDRRFFLLSMIGIVQFAVLSVLAMLFYTGGSSVDHQSEGYSILYNLLSDLGRTVAYSGLSNIASSMIYNISLFTMGCLLVPFFIAMPRFLDLDADTKWFSIPGSLTGIIMSLTFIGASITPADILLDIHLLLGQIAFITGLPLAIAYTMAILASPEYPRHYAYIFSLFGIIQFIFLIVMFLYLSGGGEISMIFAIGQKIAVYGLIACIFVQSYGASNQETG